MYVGYVLVLFYFCFYYLLLIVVVELILKPSFNLNLKKFTFKCYCIIYLFFFLCIFFNGGFEKWVVNFIFISSCKLTAIDIVDINSEKEKKI